MPGQSGYKLGLKRIGIRKERVGIRFRQNKCDVFKSKSKLKTLIQINSRSVLQICKPRISEFRTLVLLLTKLCFRHIEQ